MNLPLILFKRHLRPDAPLMKEQGGNRHIPAFRYPCYILFEAPTVTEKIRFV